MHRCPSVLPEDVSAKTRVVKLCRAGVGQVRGTFAGRVPKNHFGFHFGGVVHSLSAFVYMNDPCTCVYDGHLYLEYFSSFHIAVALKQ